MSALRCRRLTVEFAGRRVLDDLTLDIAPAGICAVVGASGSGKTTLLRSISGLVELDRGTVEIDGVDMVGVPPERRPSVMLFQEPRLFPALTVAENVGFARRVAGEDRPTWTAAAEVLLDQVGLVDRADDPVGGLSGGEQQRVALARALCAAPSVVLLDEPFASVDAPRRSELRRLVAALAAERAMTMVMVTHDVRDAVKIANTMAVLVDGRIVQHDDVARVIDAPVDDDVAALTRVE